MGHGPRPRRGPEEHGRSDRSDDSAADRGKDLRQCSNDRRNCPTEIRANRVIPYSVHMDWSIFATLVQIVAMGALTFGAVLLVGVLGGQWLIRRQVIEARDAAELANKRITSEMRTRAGEKGREAREEAKSLEVQAAEHLAAAKSPYGPQKRPSTVALINGGK